MNKNEIYQQIRNFNNAPSNPNVKNSKSVVDTYLYVKDTTAIDTADFFTFLKDNETALKDRNWSKMTVLDMAFGSGNLTSRLVLENFEDFHQILFNDINSVANFKLVKVYPTDKPRF